jgi:epoxyqueuosine reductase
MADWIFGCDICQEVCPWNRRAPGSAEPTFQPRDGRATLPLAELLALDDAGFRSWFKGSPLTRAKRSGCAATSRRPTRPRCSIMRAAGARCGM